MCIRNTQAPTKATTATKLPSKTKKSTSRDNKHDDTRYCNDNYPRTRWATAALAALEKERQRLYDIQATHHKACSLIMTAFFGTLVGSAIMRVLLSTMVTMYREGALVGLVTNNKSFASPDHLLDQCAATIWSHVQTHAALAGLVTAMTGAYQYVTDKIVSCMLDEHYGRADIFQALAELEQVTATYACAGTVYFGWSMVVTTVAGVVTLTEEWPVVARLVLYSVGALFLLQMPYVMVGLLAVAHVCLILHVRRTCLAWEHQPSAVADLARLQRKVNVSLVVTTAIAVVGLVVVELFGQANTM